MDFPNRYIIDISYSFCRLLNDFSICVKKMADCWQRTRLPYWESLNMPTLQSQTPPAVDRCGRAAWQNQSKPYPPSSKSPPCWLLRRQTASHGHATARAAKRVSVATNPEKSRPTAAR